MSMFHLVQFSLWPLTSAIGALTLTVGIVFWFCYNSLLVIIMANILIFFSATLWWRDVTRESNGHHTSQVVTGFKFGMILFILSEVMFFFSFFWAFFSSSGAPTIEVGSCWPPIGITVINAFQVPLLNTLVLLTSGMTVTWSHHCILNKNFKEGLISLLLTIILGVYFTILQLAEYSEASFSISDSVYGTTFFVTTGFHGLHVMIGTTFLLVNLFRYSMNHFSSNHHFGFEAAAWYWHFVDVVWLFLFVCVYWWGS